MRPCVLCADDEKTIIDTQRRIMKKYGFEIRSTTKLRDMKVKIKANEIDCIYVDILFDPEAKETNWDKPNGLNELKNVLEGRTDIPVMVISGYIDLKTKQQAEKYGISNVIYKWYSKPADYDQIALDTIKAINQNRFNKVRSEIVDYIGKLDENSTRILKNAFSTLPNVARPIKLKPSLLLNKLENLSIMMHTSKKEKDVDIFKELVSDLICDYFRVKKGCHLALAEHFRGMILQVKYYNLITDEAFDLISNIIEIFKKEKLTYKDVYEVRIKMEKIFKIRIKLKIKAEEYIGLI